MIRSWAELDRVWKEKSPKYCYIPGAFGIAKRSFKPDSGGHVMTIALSGEIALDRKLSFYTVPVFLSYWDAYAYCCKNNFPTSITDIYRS